MKKYEVFKPVNQKEIAEECQGFVNNLGDEEKGDEYTKAALVVNEMMILVDAAGGMEWSHC
jgi:hypothetical protein